jgi:hypothetical protein
MTRKIGKHITKILVFMLNLLLMAIAVLVIKQKEDAKKTATAQDELKNSNSFLDEENTRLKNDLDSLKGILKTLEANVIETDSASLPVSNTENTSVSPSDPAPASASNINTSNTVPSQAAPSTGTATAPSTKTSPASNSKTKTS